MASMTERDIREHVANMYASPYWRRKVEHMPFAQVLAIFRKNEQKKTDEMMDRLSKKDEEDRQFNLFDDFGVKEGET